MSLDKSKSNIPLKKMNINNLRYLMIRKEDDVAKPINLQR